MKISSRVKLPLKICSGSVNERNRYAENMLSNFVNKIEPELNKRDELSLQRIQAIIKETIPYRKIYVETVESNNNAGNNFLIHCNENGKLDALAVELETNKNGKIAKDQCNALYHETWHVFEHISNPKYLARTMSFNDYLTEKYLNFYHRHFYTDNKYNPKILTKKLSKFIEKFKDKDKISILQQLRYDLQEEHNAYSIAQKYAPENEDFTKFNFLEKKEIATQKLKDVFKQIRGKE